MPNIVKMKSSKTIRVAQFGRWRKSQSIKRIKFVYIINLAWVQSFSLVASGGSGGGSGWTYVKLLADADSVTSNVDTLLCASRQCKAAIMVEGKFFS
jgi:hypothetical protein